MFFEYPCPNIFVVVLNLFPYCCDWCHKLGRISQGNKISLLKIYIFFSKKKKTFLFTWLPEKARTNLDWKIDLDWREREACTIKLFTTVEQHLFWIIIQYRGCHWKVVQILYDSFITLSETHSYGFLFFTITKCFCN